MKKIIASILAATLLVTTLVSCSNEPSPKSVIAHVTSDVKDPKYFDVTYAEFMREYKFYLMSNEIDEKDEANAESLNETRRGIMQYLCNERIALREAADNGFTLESLTPEELSAIDETVQKNLAMWYKAYEPKAKKELGETATAEALAAKGKEIFQKELAACDLTEEYMYNWERSTVITRKLTDKIMSTIKEPEGAFEELVKEAEETYKEDVSAFENHEIYRFAYVPEGTRVIKHILINFDKESAAAIAALRKEGKNEEADALRTEKTATIKSKTDEVLQKIKDGGNFDELMAEYSDDKGGLSSFPEGYTMYKGTNAWVPEFTKGSFELEKIGDTSQPIVTDYGNHILLYDSDYKLSDRDRKTVTNYLLNDDRSALADETVKSWDEKYVYEYDYKSINVKDPATTTAATTTVK